MNTLIESDNGRRWTKALWLNPESEAIELIDVVQSSKSRKVVSMRLEQKT